MARRLDVFYAYPSHPASLGETISAALRELSSSNELKSALVRFRPWPELSVSGIRLVGEITAGIDRCQIFACDATYLNSNVAFELGYATATFKRLWISLDSSIEGTEQAFKRLYTGMMLGLGYSPYENHHRLAANFLLDRPWVKLDQHLLPSDYRRQAPRPEIPSLIYVKPPAETDAVIQVSEYLTGKSIFSDGLTIDDPRENAAPTLEWYAEKVHSADAVVVHLLSDDHREKDTHNSKASFVAGLARGFRKPLLMLAHSPFTCPTDYQLLLKTHSTAQDAENALTRWIDGLELPRRRPRRTLEREASGARFDLRKLSMGEPVAEHENLMLDDYFVETSAFFEALEAQATVFVGRRGTGKTATLFAMQAALGQDRRNHVCTIKPVGYEVDGLIRLLAEDWQAAERGFLIESLWKFLIYSELAGSVVKSISNRPIHQRRTADEAKLVAYVEDHAAVLLAPFSQRLGRAVGDLSGASALEGVEAQRARISEFLHISHLGRLRQMLGSVLASSPKVAILIDNLDEPWRSGSDTGALSALILGLLREIQQLADDFHHQDFHQKAINVWLTTFIRSDIFAYIQPLAREQDKWPVRRVAWNDGDLLLRVVEERMLHGAPPRFTAENVWSDVFPAEVAGLPTRQFILRHTMPRPRDVIYLVKEALALAVNRGHRCVTEGDMLDARERYGRFVFASVLAEDDPVRGRLEGVLYEFAGAAREMKRSEVESRIRTACADDQEVNFYLNLLCDVNFLAIQATDGFRWASDEKEREMLLEVAKRLAVERGWGEESFEVSPAFYQALQID